MVGFDIRDDILTGIGITSMKETPGIGTKVAGPGFLGQFRKHGLEGLTLSPRGGDIDAVSGATISSTGAVRAVNNAVTLYQALKHDIVTAWRKE
jgi:electron transport complex protein RnfG